MYNERYQYRLTAIQKIQIAQNLIDILEKDADITEQTTRFIGDWILTVADEKRKAFFDVWEIVLKNYLPTTRPILFRTCKRISKYEKIASFTGRLDCAKKFSKGKGFLLICDTKDILQFEDEFTAGDYRNSFYPLVDVLVKARNSGGWKFSERLLREYIGEDEYIMKVNLENVHRLKWVEIS